MTIRALIVSNIGFGGAHAVQPLKRTINATCGGATCIKLCDLQEALERASVGAVIFPEYCKDDAKKFKTKGAPIAGRNVNIYLYINTYIKSPPL